MIKQILLILFFASLLMSCNNGIDKSQITQKEKLISPYSDYTLYRYIIESSMAFGSGFTVIKILPNDKECDFTNNDYLRFGNDYPYWINWKNKDTIMVKCLVAGEGLNDKQPIKKEIQKWKNWTFDIEYYSIFSTGTGGDYNCESYKIDSTSISITTNEKIREFNFNDIQISVDSNLIDLNQYKVVAYQNKFGLSITTYKFRERFNVTDFMNKQVFEKIRE